MRRTTSHQTAGGRGEGRGASAPPAPADASAARRAAGPGQERRADRTAAGSRPHRAGDLYAEVTARIVAELAAGRLPWVQPWSDAGAPAPGLPRNALTARPYSGINIVILWASGFARGWASQNWLTYRQALAAGGQVRRGERGTAIVFADRFVPRREEDGSASAGSDADAEAAGAIPFLKRFAVFNVAQIDGLPARLAPDPVALGRRETVEAGERLIAASGVAVRIGGSAAWYDPARDLVQLPPQQSFFEQIDWYRTALHELVHATGHASRFGRDLSGRFGSPGYAREELVAELGSAFLCASLGIRPTVRHADYLAGWLSVLRADPRALFRAASNASRAADWLRARLPATRPDSAAGDRQ